jgi:hypothetical protein
MLATPVGFADAATFVNVYKSYGYFEHWFSALLVAMAFVSLQTGALVLYAQDLPPATKRRLLVGTGVLLAVTGLSNVAMAGVRGADAFPAEDVAAVMSFGSDSRTVFIAAVWVSGLALVGVAFAFWTAFAEHLASEKEKATGAQRQLERILRGEKE